MGTYSKYAVLFGGTNEYATGGNVLDFANNVDFSGGGFFRMLRHNVDMALISKRAVAVNQEGYELRKKANGRIALILTGTDGTAVHVETTATFDDGRYHFIGFTWAGTVSNAASNATIYVDGAAAALETAITDTLAATIANTASFQISGVNGTTRVFTGQVDSAFIYDDLLTASEMNTTLYNGGDPPNVGTVLSGNNQAWYRMGDSVSFPTLADQTSGYDLTMTNMESTDVVAGPAGGIDGHAGVLAGVAPAVSTFKMRGRDNGRTPGSDYIVWTFTGALPDFAGTGFAGGTPTPIGSLIAGSVVNVAEF